MPGATSLRAWFSLRKGPQSQPKPSPGFPLGRCSEHPDINPDDPCVAAPAPEAVSHYLQTPGQHPRGGTNLTPWPCPGGASGRDLRTWTYLIRTHRRTRTHLDRNKTRVSVRSHSMGTGQALRGAQGAFCKRSPVPVKKQTSHRSHPRDTALERRGFVKEPRPPGSLRGRQPAGAGCKIWTEPSHESEKQR